MISVPVFARSVVVAALVAAVCLPLSGPVLAVDGDKPFIWPTRGRQTQVFGCTGFWAEPRRGDCAHFHAGMDIANSRNTPIRAAADGVIAHVGWDPYYPRRLASWLVMIDHPGGYRTLYGHLRARKIDGITKGARVNQGDLIGLMDATGLATGVHLHYAVYRNGQPVNPRQVTIGPLPRRVPRNRPQPTPCTVPGYGGVGAWVGGATAMRKPETGTVCVG